MMKKILIVLIVVLIVGGLVFAAGNAKESGNESGNGDKQRVREQQFVDVDGDGVCDNFIDEDADCKHTPEEPQDGTGNQHGRNK